MRLLKMKSQNERLACEEIEQYQILLKSLVENKVFPDTEIIVAMMTNITAKKIAEATPAIANQLAKQEAVRLARA